MTQASPEPFAQRTVEATVVAHARAALRAQDETTPRIVILVGSPGNGARTALMRGVLPALPSPQSRVRGSWVTGAPVQWCSRGGDVPPTPPAVEGARVLIAACTDLGDLPGWIWTSSDHAPAVCIVDVLSYAELQDFLETRLDGPVDLDTARTLGRAAGFVPGTLAWLVDAARRTGALERIGGAWQLLNDGVEQTVAPFVRARLQAVTATQATAVFRMALTGRIDLRQLSDLEGGLITGLIREGLVEVDRDEHARLRAPMVAEALRTATPRALADAEYHRLLATGDVSGPAVQWCLDNGEVLPDAVVLASLDHSFAVHDWREALRTAEAALRFPPRLDTAAHTAFQTRVRTRAASAARFHGDAMRARLHLESAAELLPDGANCIPVQVQLAVARADFLHYVDGRPDAALAQLMELESTLRASGMETARAEVVASRVTHLCFAGCGREALTLLDRERTSARLLSPGARATLDAHEALLLVHHGRPQEALRLLIKRDVLRVGVPDGHSVWASEEAQTAYLTAAMSADGPNRFPSLGSHLQDAREDHYRPDLVTYFFARATWLLMQGRVRDADDVAQRALASARFIDPSGVSAAVLALLSQTAAMLGHRQRSRAHLAEFASTPRRSAGVIRGTLNAHRIAAMTALGEDARAGALLTEESEQLIDAGLYGMAAETLYSGVRFGRRRASSRLLGIAHHLDGELHAMRVAHARAVMDDDALALWDVSDRLQDAGCLLWAAEAAGAVVRQRRAPEALRRRATVRQQAYFAGASMPGHPLFSSAAGAKPGLTTRESEVAALINAGFSNREIAERLHLSERTVEGHVGRLYRKTGMSRRAPQRPGGTSTTVS